MGFWKSLVALRIRAVNSVELIEELQSKQTKLESEAAYLKRKLKEPTRI